MSRTPVSLRTPFTAKGKGPALRRNLSPTTNQPSQQSVLDSDHDEDSNPDQYEEANTARPNITAHLDSPMENTTSIFSSSFLFPARPPTARTNPQSAPDVGSSGSTL